MGKIERAHIEAMKALRDAKKPRSVSDDVVNDIKETHRKFLKEHSREEDKTTEESIKRVRKENLQNVSSIKKRGRINGLSFGIGSSVALFLVVLSLWKGWEAIDFLFVKRIPDKPSTEKVVSPDVTYEKEEDVSLDRVPKQQEVPKVTFKYYYNSRFGYSIAYPSCFTNVQESSNGDGCIFLRDKDTYLTVYADENVWNETLEEKYNGYKSKSPVYCRMRDNWFVVSDYTEDGRIFYQRTGIKNNVFITAILYFSPDEGDYFSPIITEIFTGFPNKRVGR